MANTKQNEHEDVIKILHKKSPNFINDHVTGVIINGPSHDGQYHLIFYSDTIDINSETGTPSEKKDDSGNTIYNLTVMYKMSSPRKMKDTVWETSDRDRSDFWRYNPDT